MQSAVNSSSSSATMLFVPAIEASQFSPLSSVSPR